MDGPRRIELTGSPQDLAMPDVCVHCGAAAAGRVRVRKKWGGQTSGRSGSYRIVQAFPRLCGDCRRRHEAEEEKTTLPRRVLLLFRSGMMIGAAMTGLGALFFFRTLGPQLWNGDRMSLLFGFGLPGFFGLVSLLFVALAWRDSEHLTVKPLTSVTSSFDFSDDLSGAFEPERRRYTLRNHDFADAFERLNAKRVWVRSGAAARRALWLRWAAMAAFAALIGVGLLAEYTDWLGG